MKKMISITISMIMLMGMSFPAGAKSYTDTDNMPCAESVKLLSDLGIMEGKSESAFEPDSDLTRAEMAAILVRLYGMDGLASGSDIFADVPSSHWGYAYIAAAFNLGIINGINSTTYSPDDNVTYEQAVKIIVCALGYKVWAEASGGYPSGYLAKASQLGLLSGVTQSSGEITRGTIAIIIKNALNVNLLMKKSYGSNSYEYVESENATILSEYLKVRMYEGQITGSYYTTIKGGSSLKEGQVSLDSNLVFDAGDTNAEELVGRYVTLYAKSNEVSYVGTVVSVVEEKGSDVIVLDAEDILPKSTASRIYYETERKEKYAVIEEGASIVYNGKPTDVFVIPEEGKITLISHSSNYFNVVLIEEYINLVVSNKNAEKNIIYFKNAPEGYEELVIDPNDTTVRTSFINREGSPASVSACAEWDIISITRSRDLKIMRAVRSSGKITGKISECSEDSIKINNTEYKVAKSLSGNNKLDQPRLGLEGTFGLDYKGRIAVVYEGTALNKHYGYLTGAAMTKGLSPTPQFKIFTSKGEMQLFDTVDKVTLAKGTENERIISKTNLLNEEWGLTDGNCSTISQLIRYEVNEENKITRIETAAVAVDEGLTREAREKYFTLDQNITTKTPFLGGNLRTFLSRYLVGDDCIIFNIPSTYSDDDSDYSIVNPKTIPHYKSFSSLRFYDINNDNSVTAIIMSISMLEKISNNAMSAIVTDIATSINEDGEYITNIDIINSVGKELTLYGDDDTEALLGGGTAIVDAAKETELNADGTIKSKIKLSALSRGDVIQYEDDDGKITAISVRLRAKALKINEIMMSDEQPKSRNKDDNYTSLVMMYSKALYVSDKGIRLEVPSMDGTEMWERVEPFSTAKVFLFDSKKEKVNIIDANSVYEGDWVYILRFTLYPQLIVVYR